MTGEFRCVTFLSDFGLADETVACCKGLLLRRGVTLPVIDISHEVPPFDIISGGWMLAGAVLYMPSGIHLAVVDPGVGPRGGYLSCVPAGRLFVGPDNGLLIPAAERTGHQPVLVHRARPGRGGACLPAFDARDIMAPVVADLVGGKPPEECGQEIPLGSSTVSPARAPRFPGSLRSCHPRGRLREPSGPISPGNSWEAG